jgi:hypothetical protein
MAAWGAGIIAFARTNEGIEVSAHIPSRPVDHLSAQEQDTLSARITTAVAPHIKATARVSRTTRLDGLPAIVQKIALTGLEQVEKITVTYLQQGKEIVKEYTPHQFYER